MQQTCGWLNVSRETLQLASMQQPHNFININNLQTLKFYHHGKLYANCGKPH